jgi:adenosylmethionine-8-amino-7-oxononanoate aminotransferase
VRPAWRCFTPFICAALATLDIFANDNVLETNRQKAALMNQLAQPLRDHPQVKNFRHTGMIWAFEIDTAAPDFARRFFAAALKHNLLLRPMGNTVYFMPPYIIDEAEMQFLIAGTLRILDELL